MHILQPKHTKLKDSEIRDLLSNLKITPLQLPKIKLGDKGLPEGCEVGDIIKIERKGEDKKISVYYRVVVA